eukprot:TRINITY_DN2514_c0_g2_i21.p2 TRINITY_DN2514_c0_g2~~TRINITY_DN2514_c0_g2_i21.p2  ORF type:complete len:265 (+),score=32.67 TRINITY_DN2514_c0_g2_i21:308-1102(+)
MTATRNRTVMHNRWRWRCLQCTDTGGLMSAMRRTIEKRAHRQAVQVSVISELVVDIKTVAIVASTSGKLPTVTGWQELRAVVRRPSRKCGYSADCQGLPLPAFIQLQAVLVVLLAVLHRHETANSTDAKHSQLWRSPNPNAAKRRVSLVVRVGPLVLLEHRQLMLVSVKRVGKREQQQQSTIGDQATLDVVRERVVSHVAVAEAGVALNMTTTGGGNVDEGKCDDCDEQQAFPRHGSEVGVRPEQERMKNLGQSDDELLQIWPG